MLLRANNHCNSVIVEYNAGNPHNSVAYENLLSMAKSFHLLI